MNLEADFVPYESVTRLPCGPVIVLAPHPDDEVIGCGGAIMRHVDQQDSVTVVLVTDGAAAKTHVNDAERELYKAARLAESRMAAKILGYSEMRSLGAEDRRLSDWPLLNQVLRDLISDIKPVTLYAPSIYEAHPDHYALAAAVWRLAPDLDSSTKLMFYEVGVPVPVNVLLDITSVARRKSEALRCFRTQLDVQEYVRHMEALNIYRTYTLPAEVRAAEGYISVDAGKLAREPMLGYGRSRLTDRINRGDILC